MFGPELVRAFGEFKAIWDPDNKMNPHKVVDPYLPGENLRLGPAYNPPQVETHFKFPDDNGSFAYATERCVGIGECRKEENGHHVPQLHGDQGGDALDPRARPPALRDAPGRPDEGGLEERDRQGGARPLPGLQGVPDRVPDERRHGHVQGRVPLALLRGAAAAAARLRDGPDLLVGAAGVAGAGAREPDHARAGRRQGRSRRWAGSRPGGRCRRSPRRRSGVVVSPAAAAERRAGRAWSSGPTRSTTTSTRRPPRRPSRCSRTAGFQVVVPRQSLCCGRPLYDFGMLDTAKGLLREILDALRPEIEAGTPVVGLEPSCVAVFRDELMNLFPMDEDAKRLSGQHLHPERVPREEGARTYRLPKLKRKALVQKHCHHEHVMKFDAENAVPRRSWGSTTSCSTRAAAAWPARSASRPATTTSRSPSASACCCPPCARPTDDTLIIADGFSCREQIAGLTGRGALHLAQVIQMAMHEGPEGPSDELPEMQYQPLGKWEPAPSLAAIAAVAGLGVLAGLGVVWALTRQTGDRSG